ncbi:acetyl esterase [Microdochium nivale]|nr:acetyl esterase [Microdochium nivale]
MPDSNTASKQTQSSKQTQLTTLPYHLATMYDTREEIEALATRTDPDFEKLITSSAGNFAHMTLSFKDMVSARKASQVISLADTPTEFTVKALLRDGTESEVRVNKPPAAISSTNDKTALVVLVYGGGFCLGHWSHMGRHARALAYLLGVTVASVSYRLAPEYKFPQAPRDVWDSLVWLTSATGLAALGGDVDPAQGLVVGGISAGANLATVVVQRDAAGAGMADQYSGGGKPQLASPVTGLWASIPIYYEAETVPAKYQALWFARDQNADAYILNKKGGDVARELCRFEPESPEFCPGYGAVGKAALAKMPPTYIQACGQDILRDDALIFEKVLRDDGIQTRLDVYPGVPHGFAELTDIPLARQNRADALKGIAWLLHRSVPSDDECHEALRVADETAPAPA